MKHDYSFFDKTNLKWLRDNTIFLTIHGSHSYGTNIETSDIDYRGIAIAPLDYYFSFDKGFEQQIFKEPDVQIFDLRKFFNLAANCNPNVLEILFTDPSDHAIIHPIMKKLFDNREKFLTKRAKFAFFGFAKAQMHRIEGHAVKFTNPPKACPTRKDFGLPEHTLIPKEQLDAANAAIQKRLDGWNPDFSMLNKDVRQEIEQKITDVLMDICGASIYINKEALWKEAVIAENINPNIVQIIKKEREYRSKMKQWESYQTWLLERNEARAELERKHGFDVKHGLHLVRLSRMCKEILSEGKMIVKRPDAKELIAIRNGSMTYDELIDYADKMQSEIDELYNKSSLPDAPDRVYLNNLCNEMIQEFLQFKD